MTVTWAVGLYCSSSVPALGVLISGNAMSSSHAKRRTPCALPATCGSYTISFQVFVGIESARMSVYLCPLNIRSFTKEHPKMMREGCLRVSGVRGNGLTSALARRNSCREAASFQNPTRWYHRILHLWYRAFTSASVPRLEVQCCASNYIYASFKKKPMVVIHSSLELKLP